MVSVFTPLGKHRKSLNDDQKDEFKKIFREYFLKSFSSRLVEYKEAKIVVISEDIKNDKYTIVKSKLLATSDRPEVSIDWRVYTKRSSKTINKRSNNRRIKFSKNSERRV